MCSVSSGYVFWLCVPCFQWVCVSSGFACDRDVQCGFGLCCAVSLWLRGLRMCIPRGEEGDECHPFSHKVPYPGKRQHHTCPCLPHLVCTSYTRSTYRCTKDFKNLDF
uniref:Prokineticin domain-containing protein n=1 Tax=Oncorhynchus tshawytscha TaxID=74940 RepID=A0AAZ3NM95_ONCTS